MVKVKNLNVNYEGDNLNEIGKNQITTTSKQRIGMISNEQKAELLMLLKARKSKDCLLDPAVKPKKQSSCNISILTKNRIVYS